MKPPLLQKLIAVKPYKNTILIKLSASRLGNLAAPTKGQLISKAIFVKTPLPPK